MLVIMTVHHSGSMLRPEISCMLLTLHGRLSQTLDEHCAS